ncbi:nuclear envelope integral membrane protein 2 [Sphaerodactylus townsendi]|uniref:nuclear envelope integral membrane protein 2 n=1 Tax=Sphaerodactylus townsendi TaxID=933632 RepID=UPI00202604D8|nr:nuclear envelope integral membrane protein 2 [Sphaerodactylus townsendi]
MRPGARRRGWPGLLALLLLLDPLGASGGGGELALAEDDNCRNVKVMDVMHTSEPNCYCYVPNGAIHLKNTWSSIQVKINSTGPFKVAFIPEESRCQSAETLFAFLKCLVQNIWQSGTSNGTAFTVAQYGERTCFRVQPESRDLYTMDIQQTMLDKKLFLLFVTGGLLFHFAHHLSRSVTFYYSAGVAFGVLVTLVFLLLMLKRFIPKLSTFWILMSGGWFCSLYLFYTLKEDLKLLWRDHTPYILGYVLIAGSISFAVCYQHGPLGSEKSMNLLMRTLQFAGLVLIYLGIAAPQVAYAAIAAMLCSKILHYPLGIICSMGRKARRHFRGEKPELRYLTEDEYREQGESETLKALEELRAFCQSPSFPSWVAMVKLQSPQKFANFVLGFPHVSPEETKAHDEQYSIGGPFLEEQLFTSETGSEPDPQTDPFQEEEEREQMQPRNSLPVRSREFL